MNGMSGLGKGISLIHLSLNPAFEPVLIQKVYVIHNS